MTGPADVPTIETVISPADTEETRVVEARFTLLPYDSEFEGTVGVYRDVTRQRTRERALERKNRRLQEFADIVSHDLRNPLNVAQSRLELVRDEHDSEHLDSMDDALWRMEAIIEDTLTLARQGAAVEHPEAVELADLARPVWPVDDGAAELQVVADVTVSGDPARLRLVLSNLLANARRHAGEGVTVGVGPRADDGFYVADDGPGIPGDDRERVFEPGVSTDRDATGFGLTIVEHVVEAHGWEIDVTESEPGGARFEIDTAPAWPRAGPD